MGKNFDVLRELPALGESGFPSIQLRPRTGWLELERESNEMEALPQSTSVLSTLEEESHNFKDGREVLSKLEDWALQVGARAARVQCMRVCTHVGWIFAGLSDSTIRICELGTGLELCRLQTTAMLGYAITCETRHALTEICRVLSIDLSPDRKWLAAGYGDSSCHVWKVEESLVEPWEKPQAVREHSLQVGF